MARTRSTDEPDLRGGRMRVPRSRGAVGGLLLLVLGIWGALIPLVGPYVDFGYTPNSAWHLTAGRFWLELLPGVVTAVGGLLLLVAANRVVTSFGAWLAVAGGAWFVVGPTLRSLLHIGSVGGPIHTSTLGSTLETLLLFTGIGALILVLAATALGRLSVVGSRDVRAAQRREKDQHDSRGRDVNPSPGTDTATPAHQREDSNTARSAEVTPTTERDVKPAPQLRADKSTNASGATRLDR